MYTIYSIYTHRLNFLFNEKVYSYVNETTTITEKKTNKKEATQ